MTAITSDVTHMTAITSDVTHMTARANGVSTVLKSRSYDGESKWCNTVR